MDYIIPTELVSGVVRAAEKKANLSARDLLVCGMLAGGLLAYATSTVFMVLTQGLPPIAGVIVFPAGFVMLVLLGFELSTGNFAILPLGWLAGCVPSAGVLRNWAWTAAGNLAGSVLYALLFCAAITSFGVTNGGALGDRVRQLALKKTAAYAALGDAGWAAAFVKPVLCNWMVAFSAIGAFTSRSTPGKIVAMWLPITMFFALGYEHSVVNMFVIPAGMLFGAPVSVAQWFLWNRIPVTPGNILGGAVFTGLALWSTHSRVETPAPAIL
ncbi:MAG: formate/nitrite transporter family protein, partial [Bryobacteraceae bacterium]